MDIQPGETFYATLQNAPAGIVGTVGVQLLVKSSGAVKVARHTSGIAEQPTGSGTYVATMVAPVDKGTYVIFWDLGSISPETTASEDLDVVTNPIIPPTPGGVASANASLYQDIRIYAGATFRQSFVYRDEKGRRVNLSGWKLGRMQVRPNYKSNKISLSIDSSKEEGAGQIVYYSNGVITVEASAEETAAMKLKGNRGVWSLEVESEEGEVARLFYGTAFLEPDPTR